MMLPLILKGFWCSDASVLPFYQYQGDDLNVVYKENTPINCAAKLYRFIGILPSYLHVLVAD